MQSQPLSAFAALTAPSDELGGVLARALFSLPRIKFGPSAQTHSRVFPFFLLLFHLSLT